VRSASSYANPCTFTGREWDSETGLFYYRARFLHAQLGRFVGRDAAGYADGMSFYPAYFVPNDVDPFGLACQNRCCCCASDVKMKGNAVQQTGLYGLQGIGAKFVIEFDANWVEKIIDPTASDDKNDCTLIWNERSTRGLVWPKSVRDQMIKDAKKIHGVDVDIKPQKPKVWYDQYTEYWFLKMFRPWRDERKKPCPGHEVTPIEDTAGLWGAPGTKLIGTNIIQFELILKASPNCNCDENEKEKKFCFELYANIKKSGEWNWKVTEVKCTPEKIPAVKY
jgi:RHS repeat-associated protein